MHIASKTVLWTAESSHHPPVRWLGAEMDKSGRVRVNVICPYRSTSVFVIGDTATAVVPIRNLFGVKRKDPAPLPGVAQRPSREEKYVAWLLRRRIGGKRSLDRCHWTRETWRSSAGRLRWRI